MGVSIKVDGDCTYKVGILWTKMHNCREMTLDQAYAQISADSTSERNKIKCEFKYLGQKPETKHNQRG